MTTVTSKISNVAELLSAITREYDRLSRQLKAIGQYVEREKGHLSIQGIQQVAAACEVQPSAVVRFAKHFGFTGFQEMQALFKADASQQLAPNSSYQARIRDILNTDSRRLSSSEIAQAFIAGSVTGMEEQLRDLDTAAFDNAVSMLKDADAIWICGSRRSFPVAVYLDYALQHTDKRIGLISALGNMQHGQLRSVRKGDVMLAVSFTPYAQETIDVLQEAHALGARLIAITDSRMSPLAKTAEVSLLVQDNVTFGFRSLTATMGLAQSLFIALTYALELQYQPTMPQKDDKRLRASDLMV